MRRLLKGVVYHKEVVFKKIIQYPAISTFIQNSAGSTGGLHSLISAMKNQAAAIDFPSGATFHEKTANPCHVLFACVLSLQSQIQGAQDRTESLRS